MTADNEQYRTLMDALMRAYDQSANGKGKERHGTDKPFEQQDICTITRNVGIGFPLGQAVKKINEAVRIGDPAFMQKELLGAIVYTAAAIHVLSEGAFDDIAKEKTMKYLRRNDDCIGCGFCEERMPGLYVALRKGPLMLNEANPITDMDAVRAAVKGCKAGALELSDQ